MTDHTRPTFRPARAADYDAIAAVVDDWWGRPVLPGLPRLFLDHFHRTSLIAETAGALSGFLVGIMSPSAPDEAYIHYVGVHPAVRAQGLARDLYDRFFQLARAHDRHLIRAITSPAREQIRQATTPAPSAGHKSPQKSATQPHARGPRPATAAWTAPHAPWGRPGARPPEQI